MQSCDYQLCCAYHRYSIVNLYLVQAKRIEYAVCECMYTSIRNDFHTPLHEYIVYYIITYINTHYYSDILYTSVIFYSLYFVNFVIDAAYLFVDSNKLPVNVKQSLSAVGVQFLPYEGLLDFIKTQKVKGKIWVDGRTANQAVYR